MPSAIVGLGTAVPAHCIEQAAAAEVAKIFCRDAEEVAWLRGLYRQTAIKRRHMVFHDRVVKDVLHGTSNSGSEFLPDGRADCRGPATSQRMQLYNQEASPLAIKAACQALASANLQARELTHLVTISCTGFTAPGLDFHLIEGLKLPASISRAHIGFMGCHAAINGLRVAAAFAQADSRSRVLVSAVELCSLHYFYGWDPKKMVANALFADGSAAVICVPADVSFSEAWTLQASGSCLFAGCAHAMTWDIGNHGFEMMLSSQVPRLIASNLRPWLETWLKHEGLSIADVGSWAIHPGGPRILEAIEDSLVLPKSATQASRDILAEFGNMSSPTILFILDRLRRRRAPRPCLAMAFGPGLTVEVLLLS
jgi:prepilin-type processing-associated H-X9-DG protein